MTEGKKYSVLKAGNYLTRSSGYVRIVNDSGQISNYAAKHFEPVEEEKESTGGRGFGW